MNPTEEERFRVLYELAGLGKLLPEHEAEIMADFNKRIDGVEQFYTSRYGRPADIRARCDAHPLEMAAFVQSIAAAFSPAICTMALRMLEGESIKSLSYHYAELEKSTLSVTLTDGETFQSDDIWDSGVFRHFLASKTDMASKPAGRPVLDGFYAFHVPRT